MGCRGGERPVAAGNREVERKQDGRRIREYVREMKDGEGLGIQRKQSAMSARIYLYPQPNLLSLPRALERSSHARAHARTHAQKTDNASAWQR